MNMTFAPFPRGEFSPIAITIYPAWYRPGDRGKYMLPLVGLQWWVSPNLALLGGIAHGASDKYIVQYVRVGLRYLLASLGIGPFTPEFYVTQNKVTGLNPSVDQGGLDEQGNKAYDTRWNEIGWCYAGRLGGIHWSGSVLHIDQRTFVKSGGRLDLSYYLFSLSTGYDIFPWLRCSARLVLHSPLAYHTGQSIIRGGVQLSLAI